MKTITYNLEIHLELELLSFKLKDLTPGLFATSVKEITWKIHTDMYSN